MFSLFRNIWEFVVSTSVTVSVTEESLSWPWLNLSGITLHKDG